jgi:hypothetical protein
MCRTVHVQQRCTGRQSALDRKSRRSAPRATASRLIYTHGEIRQPREQQEYKWPSFMSSHGYSSARIILICKPRLYRSHHWDRIKTDHQDTKKKTCCSNDQQAGAAKRAGPSSSVNTRRGGSLSEAPAYANKYASKQHLTTSPSLSLSISLSEQEQ